MPEKVFNFSTLIVSSFRLPKFIFVQLPWKSFKLTPRCACIRSMFLTSSACSKVLVFLIVAL